MKNYKYIISGKVQGVYYRKNVEENALKSGFKGYVKNLSNGDVEAAVSCIEEQLEKFLEILKTGSPNSRVDNIQMIEIDEQFENFEIRY